MAKKTCVIYDSWGTMARELPAEQAGKLFQAICAYGFSGEEIEIDDPAVNAMFVMIKKKLDEDAISYHEKVERMKKNRTDNRHQTDVCQKSDSNQTDVCQKSDSNQTEVSGVSVSVSVSDNNINNNISSSDSGKKSHARFVPPTVPEVQAYCLERKNNVNAEQFVDFYTSKGWKVGNNTMKDWKACVRTWERNRSEQKSSVSNQKIHNFEERRYDYGALEKMLIKN